MDIHFMKSRVTVDTFGSLWILCTFITVVSARRWSPHTEVLRGRFHPQLLDLYAILAKKAKSAHRSRSKICTVSHRAYLLLALRLS